MRFAVSTKSDCSVTNEAEEPYELVWRGPQLVLSRSACRRP